MHLFDPSDSRPIHFMGVAGAGMSALALVALRRGIPVTGCDLETRDASDVQAAGGLISRGHANDHVVGVRALVYTAAVPPNHPEVEAAQAARIPVLKRAEALGALVHGGEVIAISGTHGKTTTTAMVTEVLAAAGLRPTGLVGGRVGTWEGNARIDGTDCFVVEADEYDRSFLALHPTVAVINNVEPDHMECYGSAEALDEAFRTFAGRARVVLVNSDDPGAVRVANRLPSTIVRVGFGDGADVRLSVTNVGQEGSEVLMRSPDGASLEFSVGLPGRHNVRNAAMAMAVAHQLGVDMNAVAGTLGNFRGVGRRFDIRGTFAGITVVDDYAHHPTEVAATLEGARQRFPSSRITVVFQPHLFTRTQLHAKAFGVALATADRVVVTDVYPARERPIDGVSGQLVVEAVENNGCKAEWVPARRDVVSYLLPTLTSGDVVFTLGAGNITEVATELVESLQGKAA